MANEYTYTIHLHETNKNDYYTLLYLSSNKEGNGPLLTQSKDFSLKAKCILTCNHRIYVFLMVKIVASFQKNSI